MDDYLNAKALHIQSKSFSRMIGFHVASCDKCGEWWSGTDLDIQLSIADHPCGTMKVLEPTDWRSEAVAEGKVLGERKLYPYLLKLKVKPSHEYMVEKTARFSRSIDQLLVENGGEGIGVGRKIKFIVGNRCLPGMTDSEAKSKPIERYWPAFETPKKYFDAGLKLDVKWYENMIGDYIMSGFGFDSLSSHTQRDLSAWF